MLVAPAVGWKQLLEKSAFPSDPHRALPEAYYCPITCDLIHEPVIDPEGYTYEKAAAYNWIRTNRNSPLTRTKLAIKDLRANNALHDLIDEEKGRSEGSIHPSIRRWKESPPPGKLFVLMRDFCFSEEVREDGPLKFHFCLSSSACSCPNSPTRDR